jgi:nicotinamidase-related amidase
MQSTGPRRLAARTWQHDDLSGTCAPDFCIAWTALDGRQVGFKAFVIEDASRGDLKGSVAKAWGDMESASSRLTSW